MRILLWIRREIVHILPVFFFFLFFFTLINWTETYLFEKSGVQGYRFLQVVLAAALIAKIVLILDHLPLINRFRKHPLAYGILWKTFLYWIILFIVRLLIRFAPFFWVNTTHVEWDLGQFFEKVQWNVFLSIQVYYLMLLFIFVVFQELAYKIGVKRVRQIFFGK